MANDNDDIGKSNDSNNSSKNEEVSNNDAESLSKGKDEKEISSSNVQSNAADSVDDGEPKATRSILNDLVADLCISSSSSNQQLGRSPGTINNNGYGDYTNIRATTGLKQYSVENTVENTSTTTSTVTATTQASHVPVQNSSSSFSFKHFLNSRSAVTAPSTTVTSLDSMIGLADSTSGNSLGNVSNSNQSQTSTGARPKVPQSASVCGQISSLASSGAGLSTLGTNFKINKDSTSKMKRSPRFSSFDSQASLAEYAGGNGDFETSRGCTYSAEKSYNQNPEPEPEENCDDYFNTTNFSSRAPVSSTNKSSDYDSCQYIPRSYSNYDLHSGTTRRRIGYTNSNRPNRLPLNYTASISNSSTDFNLPSTSGATTSSASSGGPPTVRPSGLNLNDLPHGAAVLPDFVQDHWLDSWYAHDMHLISPPSTPISDIEDINAASGMGGVTNATSSSAQSSLLNREHLSADCSGNNSASIGINSIAMGCNVVSGGNNNLNDSSVSSTMLPDFLSDGPIIHSSQRIADVAVGLPSNSMGSPDESIIQSQLSRVLSDNDRLHRELNEVRAALNEQTRRSNDLERQLLENQQKEKITCSEKQTQSEAPEGSIVSKMQSQIVTMKNEIERLRRENDLLKEGGAVGGIDEANNGASSSSNTRRPRPSRPQFLSRDLRLAASTAENHLRQLLAGVENLRQMAVQIDNTGYSTDDDDNFTNYQDFFNYEDYSGHAP